MVSHHKMVSPQNGDTRGGPSPPRPPSDATDKQWQYNCKTSQIAAILYRPNQERIYQSRR